MFRSQQPILLASCSPRRNQFFRDIGLDFISKAADIDEQRQKNESGLEYVERMAIEKGDVFYEQYPEYCIVAADTIVVKGDVIFGKPRDAAEALDMLVSLAGCSHRVMTAFFVGNQSRKIRKSQVVTTQVTFASFSVKAAAAYVRSGEPMDKAGAYGIQGLGGVLVEKIDGSYSNVVGLPMVELIAVLLGYNIISYV